MSYNSKYTGAEVDAALGKALTALQEHQDISGKQDVISDLAAIRSGASKGATALQSVPSEYVTEDELTNKGYATASAMNAALGNKVDKVSGKQLSTEDFTTALKNKLNGLSNYDDASITGTLNKLRSDFDALVNGDTTAAIKSFNDVVAFLEGLTDNEDLEGILASIEQQIAGKQDAISDLAAIRNGAGKGATAVQPSSLHAVATSGSYNDLSNKPTIPSAVTESTVSGWGFTKNTGTITGVKMNGASKGTSGVVDLGTVITAHQDISGKLDKTTAASTYLSKTDASNTYLGKTAKASSAATADSATKAAQDASGNVITSTYATKTELSKKQDKVLKFENKAASSWESDSAYADYPYRCDISCSGVTADMYADVVFNLEQSISGNYAPVCETKANVVSVWSKENTTITIPTIIITK